MVSFRMHINKQQQALHEILIFLKNSVHGFNNRTRRESKICNLIQNIMHLLTPSRLLVTKSMTPPVGLTTNPIKPRPMPLKNPSTPVFLAPVTNYQTENNLKK